MNLKRRRILIICLASAMLATLYMIIFTLLSIPVSASSNIQEREEVVQATPYIKILSYSELDDKLVTHKFMPRCALTENNFDPMVFGVECKTDIKLNIKIDNVDEESLIATQEIEQKIIETSPAVIQEDIYVLHPVTRDEASTIHSLHYFSIDGEIINTDYEAFLYHQLEGYGLTWFYETAVCQIYLESRWQANAITDPDCGICQYRSWYWDEKCAAFGEYGDIMDPYFQLRMFARQMYIRYCQGQPVEYMVSGHYTGDYGYSADYVNNVYSLFGKLVVIG